MVVPHPDLCEPVCDLLRADVERCAKFVERRVFVAQFGVDETQEYERVGWDVVSHFVSLKSYSAKLLKNGDECKFFGRE